MICIRILGKGLIFTQHHNSSLSYPSSLFPFVVPKSPKLGFSCFFGPERPAGLPRLGCWWACYFFSSGMSALTRVRTVVFHLSNGIISLNLKLF